MSKYVFVGLVSRLYCPTFVGFFVSNVMRLIDMRYRVDL